MKLQGPPIIVLYGFLTVSVASKIEEKITMDYKDIGKLEKTQQIPSNCEEDFSSQILHCIEPFSRKVKQYTHIKPENPFVYQIFVKHACRKYKKMLLCVHTYLTNCPTKSSYSAVQKSLDQAWVPMVNQMCKINTNSSKDIVSNVDQTQGKNTASVSTEGSPLYQIQNDFPVREGKISPHTGKFQESISVITFLDRIVLPKIDMDSRVPVILNSKDKITTGQISSEVSHKTISRDYQDLVRGKNLFHWMYIVIGNSDPENKIQYFINSNRDQQREVTLSQKSSASHVILSVLCVWQVLVVPFLY
ncbi:uncharacterized protein LOC133175875 [Saccostrea echinata]|uniref:uncharacterized protein LOC133175875 n=1 Tax=Saccostrea echinata TaxID=191078 RepID=UPI002A840043|nr:uncharacterized protein LOC133175875 [Saccostrea echinata]